MHAICKLSARALNPLVRFFSLVLPAVLLLSVGAATPSPPAWHSEGAARWAELPVPKTGQTGFTLLTPQQTGVYFTNSLDESSSAANRVLENGSGVAVGDFDHDGRPDIFLCSLKGRSALYRNLGNFQFEDVTPSSGIDASNYICRGAVFADVDGDGWPDLLISTLGHGVLCFHNNHNGRFTNVTASAGTETSYGSMTLALADIDGNGTLDLYVSNYRTDDIRDRSRIDVQRVGGQIQLAPWLRDRLILVKEGLFEFGEPDLLYLNDGQGHFHLQSWTGGTFLDQNGRPLQQPPLDWGLTAAFHDLNGDGAPDLYVCNDYWTPDRLWLNNGRGQFQLAPKLALRHTSENSMGVDFADIDRDGQIDFIVLDMLSRDGRLRRRQASAQTKFPGDSSGLLDRPQIMQNTLFRNRGDGTFAEIANFARLPASDWSWQPLFMDVDLDGYDDLVISAGHTRDVQDIDATRQIAALQHPWPKDLSPQARQQAFTREMMEHARLYPKLEMPIVAFRNLGNLRFEEMTPLWGTDALGVHQGIAFADFDGDGDLDLVVNNLNSGCGIYRNNSAAPRVAVRLNGTPPNTQAIGARVTLRHGAVPAQTSELTSGGRYLSGAEPLLVFAAGYSGQTMSLDILWRNGASTHVPNVRPNRLYEITQPPATRTAAAPAKGPTPSAPSPLFENVSSLLNHTHAENDFDDFARQPLLPKRLSQLGPGIAWFDVDGDDRDDLIISSGQGSPLSIYINPKNGPFRAFLDPALAAPAPRDQTSVAAFYNAAGHPAILAGSANYEDASATAPSALQYDLTRKSIDENFPPSLSSTGPLALADIDADGTLELFVGGRVVPGRYPEPASSRIFRQQNGTWQLDPKNSAVLEKIGMVSGAVWTDLNGDGFPELVLACEWGPILVFENHQGVLQNATAQYHLDRFTGWWNGVTAGDFDGDGRMDLAVSNWGSNTRYEIARDKPLRIFFGDFAGDGGVQPIEACQDPSTKTIVPWANLKSLAQAVPSLAEKFQSDRAYSLASMDQILGDALARARVLQAACLETAVFLNRGDHFEFRPLPAEAQWSPAFGISIADFDGDGREDIFLSQNFFGVPSETPRCDAGRGLLLRGDGSGTFTPMTTGQSGIVIDGEQRGCAVADFDQDGRADLAVTQNNQSTVLYRNTRAAPGLRVRLRGPDGNRNGIGAVLRLLSSQQSGPAREIHAGAGYGSQDSAVQVLSLLGENPRQLWVRWPGGKEQLYAVPSGTREIQVDSTGKIWKTIPFAP